MTEEDALEVVLVLKLVTGAKMTVIITNITKKQIAKERCDKKTEAIFKA